ncbi:MAG: hypothetical protein JXA14_05655 [Anaerolineae bacterium]|nr:hypothetical protein [Anaerolineae bacterium]
MKVSALGVRLRRRVILLACAFAVVAVPAAAAWIGASPTVQISGTVPVIDPAAFRRDVALAANATDVTVLWAAADSAPGIHSARRTGGSWGAASLLSSSQLAWSPVAVYAGGVLNGVWLEGSDPNDYRVPRALIGFEEGQGEQMISSEVYGDASPHLSFGAGGLHLVYAAAETDEASRQADLYHAYRPYGQHDWPSPQTILEHDAAVPSAISAGIFRPRVLEAAQGQRLYVVWEQLANVLDGGYISQRSVWYMAGDVGESGITWDVPMPVSPPEQDYAVMPAIALTSDGNLHVAWTQLLGPGSSRTDEQHIWYWSRDAGVARPLNDAPTHVNETFPSWVASTLAAKEDMVCATWHGYTGVKGGSYENIVFRCSYDAGESWQATNSATADDQTGSIFPVLEADANGKLHFAWVRYTATPATSRMAVDGSVEPLGVYYRDGFPPRAVYLPLVARLR